MTRPREKFHPDHDTYCEYCAGPIYRGERAILTAESKGEQVVCSPSCERELERYNSTQIKG